MRVYVPEEWRCDRERWLMMRHYARCYPAWKRELNDIRLSYRAAGAGTGGGSSDMSEVEQKVERMEHLSEKVKLIEQCVRDATETKPGYYDALLMSVTECVPVDKVFSEISGRQLKKYRRRFFFQLNNLLIERKIL